jgi:hypothetical protein
MFYVWGWGIIYTIVIRSAECDEHWYKAKDGGGGEEGREGVCEYST